MKFCATPFPNIPCRSERVGQVKSRQGQAEEAGTRTSGGLHRHQWCVTRHALGDYYPNYLLVDIYHVGISATVASLVLAILVSVYAVGSVFSPTKGLFARTLRVQAGLLLAACAWLFATMIPYMIFYLHRQAKVTAFIGTTQLPASVIKAVETQSGSTGVYKQISYRTSSFPQCYFLRSSRVSFLLFLFCSAPRRHLPLAVAILLSDRRRPSVQVCKCKQRCYRNCPQSWNLKSVNIYERGRVAQ